MQTRQQPLRVGILGNHMLAVPLIRWALSRCPEPAIAAYDQADWLNQLTAAKPDRPQLINLNSGHLSWQDNFNQWFKQRQPDCIFVCSFPKRLPPTCLDQPRRGCWNFHPGPLPQYRGADPVFWALRQGAKETALTAHAMCAKLDEGDIWKQELFPIKPEDNAGSLINRMSQRVVRLADNLYDTLQNDSPILTKPQDPSKVDYHRKPTLEDTVIHWERYQAEEIVRMIRASNPYMGGAKACFDGRAVQVFEAEKLNETTESTAGKVLSVGDHGVTVSCARGTLIRLLVLGSNDGIFQAARWFRLQGITEAAMVTQG